MKGPHHVWRQTGSGCGITLWWPSSAQYREGVKRVLGLSRKLWHHTEGMGLTLKAW